jgi:hypothetical protein
MGTTGVGGASTLSTANALSKLTGGCNKISRLVPSWFREDGNLVPSVVIVP